MKIILLLVFHLFQTVLCSSIYDFKAVDIHGLEVDFDRFRGKVLLIVNVAPECGFTDSHYRELQRIQVSFFITISVHSTSLSGNIPNCRPKILFIVFNRNALVIKESPCIVFLSCFLGCTWF